MQNRTLKIGTRGSKLALWQADCVKCCITALFPDIIIETLIIKTTGDRIQDVALSKIGDKGLFTKELEQSLLQGDIDMAVHSLKDLPTELPDGLLIGGILQRGTAGEVLLSRSGKRLSELTPADRLGTSSLRRRAQLLHWNPNLQIADVRGNVDTRIRKLQEGHCDALIMAEAGIVRLGYEQLITERISHEIILPATAQGAVAVQVCDDNDRAAGIAESITDELTWHLTMAERAFLRTLDGGCHTPVGCHAELIGTNVQITGMLAALNGSPLIRASITCPLEEASEKAVELAEQIRADFLRASC
ncbi:MAG: hydroxymethylbilane synthase [Bacteroidales bacterium]|jgi:hydroxymethylbilane synthase|nr:hydroxymethylbilane synthase [Bacteroidales bacterium]